jgi:hypothetical protein
MKKSLQEKEIDGSISLMSTKVIGDKRRYQIDFTIDICIRLMHVSNNPN